MSTTAPFQNSRRSRSLGRSVCVRPAEQTFQSLLAQMGRSTGLSDGTPLPMVLEPHPGGRWRASRPRRRQRAPVGFVQSIKRPSLLEIPGDTVHVRRDIELDVSRPRHQRGTLIKFTHGRGTIPR
jgi:hypothetical protein